MSKRNRFLKSRLLLSGSRKMHKFFRENGFYRAEDLDRVLGDPSESIQVQSSVDLLQMSKQLS